MSPNVETCHEELPFIEGQFIKIYGEQDQDGFYYGESQGESGFIPCNMVSEVQVDDSFILQQLLSEINGAPSSKSNNNQMKSNESYVSINEYNKNTNSKAYKQQLQRDNQKVAQMVALYDYDPQSLSPNADMDVSV